MIDVSRAFYRRGGGRRGGRGSSLPSGLTGVQGFDASGTAYMQVASGATGAASGFFAASLMMITAQSGSTSRYMYRTVSANSGFNLRTTTTHAGISFQAWSSAPALITSPVYTVQASDVGKIMFVVGVHDGSALKLYVNRAQVGTSTAITSYTTSTATNRIGDTWTNGVIFGAACGQSAFPALADVQAWADAIKSAKRMVACPGITTDHVWNTRAAATVSDEAGSSSATVVGTGLAAVQKPLNWGW